LLKLGRHENFYRDLKRLGVPKKKENSDKSKKKK